MTPEPTGPMREQQHQPALALGDDMIERGASVLRAMLGDVLGTEQELRDMAEGVLRGALDGALEAEYRFVWMSEDGRVVPHIRGWNAEAVRFVSGWQRVPDGTLESRRGR